MALVFQAKAQPDIRARKYPSLLWEISGPRLKKPSYLIGTMHVSNKMAFNLPDSFYYALRSAQVVALETNPETWQEDMSRYNIDEGQGSDFDNSFRSFATIPADYFSINTLKFYRYNKKLERALSSNPTAINNLLYRTYGNESSDFEEDTYLDMYIFQCGKKWGKRVTGVEDYGESMRLMSEAYQDAGRDKSRKERSYGDWDEAYSTDKLQEAYRRGNLDLLDSINKYNSVSAAFDEKFLYRRNQIQAASIDSIIRSGSTLFVGVGAAHLPGDRGVIELLRAMGYRLRPVKMGERASREKDQLDKIRVPVLFRTDSAEDGLFHVDIPGKFYKYGEDAALDKKLCADMANGSYYLVTRIMTNAWMWNHNEDDVYRVVDSLLYENIPGKIISKAAINKNGYKGFDILNRTRRGDLQRYQIFITPFEVVFFKMSGNGDYVKNGPEAEKYFSSIRLREYRIGGGAFRYSPPYGGFSVNLPHEPYIGNDGSWLFDATDKTTGTHYRVIRTDIHNFHFASEDSFDLALMEESFMASDFADTILSQKRVLHQGYPALDCRIRDRKGALYLVRFIIQGPHYYTLVTRGKQEVPAMQQFINSFTIKPLEYGAQSRHTDTALYFSVNTSWYPVDKKIRLEIPQTSWYGAAGKEEKSEKIQLESGVYRNKVIRNDSTGEKIYVSFFRSSRYDYIRDSSLFEKENSSGFFLDSVFTYRFRKKTELPDHSRIWDALITDTGSSRTLQTRIIYKDGNGYTLAVAGDTLTPPSEFVKQFFNSFQPADTLKGTNPFVRKSGIFFADLFSPDSTKSKMAQEQIQEIYLDSSDLPLLKKAIASQHWEQKNYLEIKKSLINKLSDIRTQAAADYLRTLYYALDDTIQLQYPVLENLLQQKTDYAYRQFRDIINTEAPVLDDDQDSYSGYPDFTNQELFQRLLKGYQFKNGKFMDELSDSLPLTKTILPDLLPLLNLDDYKMEIMSILGKMIDSNLLLPGDYETYTNKFLLEARQELKKQSIAEKKKAIEKAEESLTDGKKPYYLRDEGLDEGNEDLSLYATLLIPFMDSDPAIKNVISQMLRSGDKRLRYDCFIRLVRSNKVCPDSLYTYFASLDDFRYELYADLKEMNLASRFPKRYQNQTDLGKSALLATSEYTKPDSVILIKKLQAFYKGRTGVVYFYRFKTKKDDLTWKLATVGLLPDDTTRFEFTDSGYIGSNGKVQTVTGAFEKDYDFTRFTNTRIRDDEPVDKLLEKELRKLLVSRHNSGRMFYNDEDDDSDEPDF